VKLEQLAKVACFSEFHFHRIFRAVAGETVANFTNRLRLEKAAREDANIRINYELEAKATREKMERLRALRLAKEAADKDAAAKAPIVAKKSGATRKKSA
jgi:YesN/AraC family two-component response regulator